jgi:hypothetical protein
LWVGPGLARKHWTRLERLASDKHSSLLPKSVKLYSTTPPPWVLISLPGTSTLGYYIQKYINSGSLKHKILKQLKEKRADSHIQIQNENFNQL